MGISRWGGIALSRQAPPVSVLLPVHDGEPHLSAAIKSIGEQTYADFEVVAVDDGSRDATPDVLAEWAASDSRVRVVRQPASGIAVALERARAEARGRFLARMDADDVSLPSRFERQLELMESDPRLALVGCLVRYFPRTKVRAGARRYENWLNSRRTHDEIVRAAFVECPLAHPSFFARASSIDEVGGYVDRPWPEDYDLFLRLLRSGGHFGKVPKVLLNWREGEGRLSRTDVRYSRSAFLDCRVHHLVRLRPELHGGAAPGVEAARPARPIAIWGAGPTGKQLAQALARQGVAVKAFAEVHPRRIGETIHGAPVLDQDEAASALGAFHLAAVGQPGARERITETLKKAGLDEGRDFVAMA